MAHWSSHGHLGSSTASFKQSNKNQFSLSHRLTISSCLGGFEAVPEAEAACQFTN